MTQRIDPPVSASNAYSASHFALATVAAGLAHDINNPLNSISTNAELALLLAQRTNQPAPEILRRIIEDCRRCAAVVQEMVQATCVAQAAAPVDLGPILESARSQVLNAYNLAPETITLLADSPSEVSGEPAALTRAVVELLMNSVHAGARRIVITMAACAGRAVIEVSDDGAGIPPALAAGLFKAFHTPRQYGPGVGLGLGIARRISVDHGGKLELRSSEQGHTCFVLTLPLAACA